MPKSLLEQRFSDNPVSVVRRGVYGKAFNPKQPRDEQGQWSSADVSAGLRQYIDMVSEMETQSNHPWVNNYLKQHGRAYPMDKKTFIGGQVQQCYKNAALAVMGDPNLTYVEGYVSVHGVPIAHSWTVNKAGTVRDVTLASPKGIRGYFGVPIKTEFLTKQLLRTKVYGILVGSDNPKAVKAVLEAEPAKVIAP